MSARSLVGLVACTALCLTSLAPTPLAQSDSAAVDSVPAERRLHAPEHGALRVAFLISEGATVIDFAGPWEVFQDVMVPGRGDGHDDVHPFQLYTVAESTAPIRATGGMQILPDHDFGSAPQPHVIVVPAGSASGAAQTWLREASAGADLTMSVCTGSFLLASIGLLDERSATTHHDYLQQLAMRHPQVHVRRDVRWVDGPRVATAAGLTSGVDLALHVVARYFGSEVAERTAAYMEHESDGWRDARGHWDAGAPLSAAELESDALVHPAVLDGYDPVRLVAGEEVRGRRALSAEHDGYTYLFASEATRASFLADPAAYAIQFDGACAFMARDGAPARSGSPGTFTVHDGKLYLFASDGCRAAFLASPEEYLVQG